MGCTCVKDLDSDLQVTRSTNDPLPPHIEETGDSGVSDICGLKHTKLIIQSGTRFIEIRSLNEGISVANARPLRSECKNGDHYLAQHIIDYGFQPTINSMDDPTGKFYVIKGKWCITVESLGLATEPGAKNIFKLHPKCQGGSHYLANRSGFYIIRNRDNTYLHVENMSEHGYDKRSAHRQKLDKSFTNGLYYFATDDYFYIVKQNAVFGLVYHRAKTLGRNFGMETTAVLPVNPSVAHFLHLQQSSDPLEPPPDEGNTSSSIDYNITGPSHSPEYATLLHLTADLQLAVKSHLTALGAELVSSGLITPDQYDVVRNRHNPQGDNAAYLIHLIQCRVQQDSQCYNTFIDVLEKDLTQHRVILGKLSETFRQQQQLNIRGSMEFAPLSHYPGMLTYFFRASLHRIVHGCCAT